MSHQEEHSLAGLEEIFVSVALCFLLTAKKSGGDFQSSSDKFGAWQSLCQGLYLTHLCPLDATSGL